MSTDDRQVWQIVFGVPYLSDCYLTSVGSTCLAIRRTYLLSKFGQYS